MKRLTANLSAASLLLAAPMAAQQSGQNVNGQLVVSFCTKGDFRPPHHPRGMKDLADTAHHYGFPVTWIIKPFTARAAGADLQDWNKKFGDEVAWFSEGTPFGSAEAELSELRAATPWQKVTSTGNTKYGEPWVRLYEKNGIESVWGRCYEQTDADNICDRGSPHGFYYLRPDCYKAPNTAPGGLVSVPWLSNDPNLVFRCGFQSTFTFDPDDALSMGAIAPGHCEYWFALVDELQKQTRYNKIVPLIIQQEYPSPGLENTLPVLDELFAYLKKKGIAVVSQAEAARRYKAAYPDRTPPTYGVFDSLGNVDAIKNPLPVGRYKLEATTERISKAFMGAPFNGFYTTEWDKPAGKRLYFHPTGKKFNEHGKLFTYYDENGLLLFEENRSTPLRVSHYLEIPPNSQGYTVLPELSYFYDTEKYIPPAKVTQTAQGRDLQIAVEIPAFEPNIAARARMPYGVMVWGDFRRFALPANAPRGAAIVGGQGLFWPVVLEAGKATQFAIALKATRAPEPKTKHTISIAGTRFLLDGKPFPYTGISFFNALYNPTFNQNPAERRRWLAQFGRYGINVLRVWCQWDNRWGFVDTGPQSTMYEIDGRLREVPLTNLKALLREADEAGMIVELCLFSHESWHGKVQLGEAEATRAVAALTRELLSYRNLTLQIWNEHSEFTLKHVSTTKGIDAARLVTSSPGFAGDMGSDAENAALDYLTPHTSRQGERPHWESAPREIAALLAKFKKPVVDDEPARNGTAALGGPQGATSPYDHVLHIFQVWQVGGYITYHHDMFQTAYGTPTCPPSGIPDPEFNPYHRRVLEFIAQRERFMREVR